MPQLAAAAAGMFFRRCFFNIVYIFFYHIISYFSFFSPSPGPDLALLQAAALVPARVPQVAPAHLVPAALVLQARVPPLPPAPQAPPAPAVDVMTTAAARAQRTSLHLTQLHNLYTL